MLQRGYFGIGVYRSKTPENIGTLWRSAQLFGASFIYTIGIRYAHQRADTYKTPKHIPLHHYPTFEVFLETLPEMVELVGVELTPRAKNIKQFKHPERAVYLLGAEDTGLPPEILDKCHKLVYIETSIPRSLNVSVTGSIVLFHRGMIG